MKDRRVNLRIKSPRPRAALWLDGPFSGSPKFLIAVLQPCRQSYWKLMRFRCSSIHLKMIKAFNQFRMAEYRAKTRLF
jgi:hypothetical protein